MRVPETPQRFSMLTSETNAFVTQDISEVILIRKRRQSVLVDIMTYALVALLESFKKQLDLRQLAPVNDVERTLVLRNTKLRI